MQRAGRVGRHELDHHALAGVRAAGAERLALVQHGARDRLLRRRRDAQVDEARTRDLDSVDQFACAGLRLQVGRQLLGDLARIAPESLGDLQGDVAGDVAVRLDLRTLEHDRHVAHAEGIERAREQVDKLLFLLGKHPGGGAAAKGRILAARERRSARCEIRWTRAEREDYEGARRTRMVAAPGRTTMKTTWLVGCALGVAATAAGAQTKAQQTVKPPVAQAWIDVATGAGMGGGMGGMGGGMAGGPARSDEHGRRSQRRARRHVRRR